MRMGTVALIIGMQDKNACLIDILSDDREIEQLAVSLQQGESDPLEAVYSFRDRQTREDDDFGNYVEELLSKPFVRPEIQEHGVNWLKSKIRIEKHQKTETEAAKVIADYAFKVFSENPDKTDFTLAGPHAQVRIRVFILERGVSQAA